MMCDSTFSDWLGPSLAAITRLVKEELDRTAITPFHQDHDLIENVPFHLQYCAVAKTRKLDKEEYTVVYDEILVTETMVATTLILLLVKTSAVYIDT